MYRQAQINPDERFDATWIANYKRYRKTLTGTRMSLDPITGYMRPIGRDGFTAEDRATFVERLKICSNITQICKSFPIDKMTFLDAVAVDEKFRTEVNAAWKIPNRPKHLNTALAEIQHFEKKTVVNELFKVMDKYK